MKELLSKNEPDLEDLENSQPIHVAKNEKMCSGENTKSVAGQSLHKEITNAFNQPSQLEPGREMEL